MVKSNNTFIFYLNIKQTSKNYTLKTSKNNLAKQKNMIKFNSKKILLPYDFSKNADKALNHAAFMAALLKSDLYLIHVIAKSELLDIILPVLKIKNNQVIVNMVSEQLETTCAKIRKEYGIVVKSIVSTGNITSEIVNIAEENKIDLIIMGTQGGGSKSDLFLGSNAYRLITKSEIPVMTIKDTVAKKGYENILLPIDLSDHSRQKVNYAISLAKAFNAKISILGLYDENEKDDKFKLELVTSQIEKLCAKSKVAFECFVDKTSHRVSKTNSFAKKHKADLIITMTDQKMDKKFGRLNSYNHELVHSSKIPVISLQPEEGSEVGGGAPGMPF